jgi:hypothetical protein
MDILQFFRLLIKHTAQGSDIKVIYILLVSSIGVLSNYTTICNNT